jgi:hypothetical protein
MIDLTKAKIIPEQEVKPSLSREQMIEAFESGEDLLGFIGGVEVDEKILDNLADVDVIPADEEGNRFSWEIWQPTRRSIDGSGKGVIYLVKVLRAGTPGRADWAYKGMDVGEFRLFVEYFGIENVMTKSEFEALVKSERYTQIQEEEGL